MRCKDSKQHHVMFHELYSVSLRLCIAQNVRFEIPYKVLYFETPFLIIFKCYAWVSCALVREFLFVSASLNCPDFLFHIIIVSGPNFITVLYFNLILHIPRPILSL